MVSLGSYLAGAAALVAVVVALALGAARLRSRLVPGWEGAPARLADAVLAVALAIWLGQLLGTVGLLEERALVAAALLIGLGLRFGLVAGPPGGADPPPPVHPLALLAAAGMTAVVFAHWGYEAEQSLNEGITNFDSLWYHLPFSAGFVQDASITGLHRTDPLFLNWFYPQNSELLHAEAMLVWGRDTLSLFLNFGWLALALLAAWCIGRPWGRGPHAVVAACVLLECHTLVVREPGAAKNDIVAAALVLSTAALLVTATARRARAAGPPPAVAAGGALATAGLAAGLAVGSRLTAGAMVAALLAAAVALAPPRERLRAAAFFAAPMLAAGGFWYLRNLLAAGNPLPWVRELGPLSLPGPDRLQEARPDFPVAHYLTDTEVWREYFRPELGEAFGPLWPLVLAAALAGTLLALARGSAPLRALAAVALVGMLAYLVTPLGAAGPEGRPTAFGINVRFAVPALLLGIVLLAVAPPLRGRRAGWALLAGLVAIGLVTNRADQVLRAPEREAGALIMALLFALPAAVLWLRGARRVGARATVAGLALTAIIALAVLRPVQDDYLRDRWRSFAPEQHMDSAYRWAKGVRDARIALAGTTAAFYAYGFYGEDLSNEVRYLGRELPRGGLAAIPTCRGFRAALDRGRFDYLVTTPFLNFAETSDPVFSPEGRWVRGSEAVRALRRDGPVTVWRIGGPVGARGCADAAAPLRYVPRQTWNHVPRRR